jgi:hypothetical protein
VVFWVVTPCSIVLSYSVSEDLVASISNRTRLEASPPWKPKISHQTLRLFENKVLRRIFGPKRTEVEGD